MRSEIVVTEAEFGLFFEGANLEKRFITRPGDPAMVESPREIRKHSLPVSPVLQSIGS